MDNENTTPTFATGEEAQTPFPQEQAPFAAGLSFFHEAMCAEWKVHDHKVLQNKPDDDDLMHTAAVAWSNAIETFAEAGRDERVHPALQNVAEIMRLISMHHYPEGTELSHLITKALTLRDQHKTQNPDISPLLDKVWVYLEVHSGNVALMGAHRELRRRQVSKNYIH